MKWMTHVSRSAKTESTYIFLKGLMRFMDDAEYVFHQDIREKKAAGRGTFHRKCGAKSKKCTLPSDRLTRKEREAMNSEVTSWSMSAFYDYATFKSMPPDIQVEYLQSMTDKWHVSCGAISEILFKSAKNSLDSYLRYRGLDQKITWHGQTGMRARVYNVEFKKAIEEVFPPIENAVIEPNPIEKPMASSDEAFSGKLVNTTISMDGFDQDTFGWLAQKYFGQNVIVTIMVESK